MQGLSRAVLVIGLLSPSGGAFAQQTTAAQPSSALGVNFDLGTLSGTLGIILTIIFFIVGYRQTIGARKERAGAANREISEILLRRFTLDSDFSLQYVEIEKFVTGKALDNRVKRSDVLSMDEISPLLYSRVVSSDYVPSEKRKSVLEKLDKSFKLSTAEHASFESIAASSSANGRKIPVEVTLGLLSASMAIAVSIVAAFLATEWTKELSLQSLQGPLFIATGVTAITAVVLVLYVRFREKATATKPDITLSSYALRAQELETRVIERLEAIGVPFTQERDVDLIIRIKQKRVAVQLKLSSPSSLMSRSIMHNMKSLLSKYGCEEGYIVFPSPVPDKIRNLGDERVKILGLDELFRLLTNSEPLRGTSAA